VTLARFEDLLKACIGLDSASVGASAIERAVQERQAACCLPDVQAYWELVQSSDTERQQLIEAVVVSETWFFRHGDAFPVLATAMREAWLRGTPIGMLTLLSVPCSTGEEPYSMAMALLDAAIPSDRFRIDAVDISTRALAHAHQGIYGKNAFRGHDLDFRHRHFDVTPGGSRIRDTVRGQVRFHRGNLFEADFLPGTERYDAIFCRNVLIYFDRETQDRAITVLKRLLKSTGTLFVAPAESSLPCAHGFVPASAATAFSFRRGERPASEHRRRAHPIGRPSTRRPAAARGTRLSAVSASPPPLMSPAPIEPATASPAGLPGTAEAMRLADQGHFAEAATCCETVLRAQGPSAAAFYVLGLVRDATGNQSEAEKYYRKALYLEPCHAEALIQLALLIETRGDRAGAQVLRNRARRLDPGEVASRV
jgi:chemotaxis protein methyltransferase WspC